MRSLVSVFIAFLVASFLGLSSFADAAPLVIEKIRLGQHGEKTRVVLESNKPLKPQHFTLPTPPRFVMDFPEVDFKADLAHAEIPPKSLVDTLRQGHFKPGVVRMVMDLNKAAVASVFTIPASKDYKFRLVVDLTPATDAQIAERKKEILKTTPKKKIRPAVYADTKKAAKTVVVVDPGHGGVDPGAIGKRKTYEKNVVLQIAKRLRNELQKDPNIKVFLTRDKDIFVPLSERVRFAQQKKADLFISLHADAHKNRRIRGGSVYVLSDKSSDKEAARLARKANEGDLMAGIDLSHESKDVQNILIDLAQRETMNKSAELAKEVIQDLGKVTKLRKDRIMFAGFRVLKAPEIPSVLVEMSYISNPTEERLLTQREHQTKLARAISNSVHRYLDK